MEKDHVVISLEKYEEMRITKEGAEAKIKLMEQCFMATASASQKVSPNFYAHQQNSMELLSIIFAEAGYRIDFVSRNSIPSLGRGKKVIKIQVPE